MMAKIKHYVLWLRPENEVREQFQALIAILSQRHHAPLFEPHVTLLGGITGSNTEVMAKIKRLALEIEPFDVQLTAADHRDEYYRCLYVKAVPTNALIEANRLAERLFKSASGNKYLPHLSLLYGDFSTQEKEKILAEINYTFDATFRVNSLTLYTTEGAPEKWRCIKTFPLMLGDECI